MYKKDSALSFIYIISFADLLPLILRDFIFALATACLLGFWHQPLCAKVLPNIPVPDSLYYLAYDSSLANPGYALTQGRLLLRWAEEKRDGENLAYAHEIIGLIYRLQYANDSARYQLQQVLNIADTADYYELEMQALVAMGDVYGQECNYSRSVDYYHQALQRAKEKEDSYWQCWVYLSIAYILEEQGQYEDMLRFLEMAENYYGQLTYDDGGYIDWHLRQLRSWYALQKKAFRQSLHMMGDLIDSAAKWQETELLTDLHTLAMKNYVGLEQKEKARYHAQRVDSLLKLSHDPYLIAQYGAELAYYHARNGQTESAESIGRQAYRLARELQNPYLIKHTAQYMAYVYTRKRQPDSVLHYYEIFYPIGIKLAGANTELELFTRNQHIENLEKAMLEKENEQAKAKLERNRLIGLVVLLLLITLLAIILFIQTSLRKNREHNRLLLEKNLQLKEHQAELERLIQTKNRLFSILAHDLREPFNQLMGVLSMQMEGMLSTEEKSALLEDTYETTKQLSESVSNLLIWSRTQLDGFQPNPEPVVVAELVQYLQKELEKPLKNKNLSLQVNLPEDLCIMADKEQLHIMLRNLMLNAIKFSFAGHRIHLKGYSEKEQHCLAISDSGTGMSEAVRQTLEDSRELVQSTPGTASEKGNGLGLSIIKEFMQSHQGSLRIASTEGKGSTFVLCFPRKECEAQAEEA